MGRLDNLEGKRFGKLVFIRFVEKRKRGGGKQYDYWWEVQCDCGNRVIKRAHPFVDGLATTCGCAIVKHLKSKSKVHRAWQSMKRRCRFDDGYIKKGTRVCDEWLHDFAAFYAHVGDPPSPAHSIDRIDNDGHYEPGNVRWATAKQQRANQGNLVSAERSSIFR